MDETPTAIVPVNEPVEEQAIFTGLSLRAVNESQAAILNEPAKPEEVEVRPDGQIYFPEMKYRIRLNRAFGMAGWGLRPLGDPVIRDGLVMQTWALYASGRFISCATGECQMVEENANMTYGDVLEGAKSVALRRLCKDLGIVSELWDRSFVEKFLEQYCVKVWVKGKNKPQWRKLSYKPFYNETTIAPDSPNKDKYVKTEAAGLASRIIAEEYDQNYKDVAVEQKKSVVTQPQTDAKVTATNESPTLEYVEGVLTYRDTPEGREVQIASKWGYNVVDAKTKAKTWVAFIAQNQVSKEMADSICKLFLDKKGSPNHFEADAHAKKHFKGVTSVKLCDYEQAAAIYRWKKDSVPDPRWYSDKITEAQKPPPAQVSKSVEERLTATGLTGHADALMVKWAKDFNLPQPYTQNRAVLSILEDVLGAIEQKIYDPAKDEDKQQLTQLFSDAWKQAEANAQY